MTRVLATLLVTACATAATLPARAADVYPSRPITLVVPFPAGGGADSLGRVVAQKMGALLGQPVVIDNRAGAGTAIGAGFAAKAQADGYTIFVSSGTTFTINPVLRANLPYDPIKSFDHLGIAGTAGLILLANTQVPVQTMKQFVEYAGAAPGKHPYASFGSGTSSHFAAEAIFAAAGVKLTHIPYKGSAPAMTDLIGGQVPFSVDTVSAAIPQLKGGKVKAIAVTTASRSALLPDVPTMAESGYQGFNMETWLGFAAPKGLPPAVKAKLEKALKDAITDKETREKLVAQGLEPRFINSAGMVDVINKELPQMRAVAARANIKAD